MKFCVLNSRVKKKCWETACETVLLATAKSPEDSFLQKTLSQRAGGCQIDYENVCEHCILKIMFTAVKPNTTRNDNRMVVSHLDHKTRESTMPREGSSKSESPRHPTGVELHPSQGKEIVTSGW